MSHSRHLSRKKFFRLFLGVVAIIALIASVYWYFVSSLYVVTDNAYVAGEVAQITPFVDGTIKEVKVVDTQKVQSGDVLVQIDDIDANLTLAKAKGVMDQARVNMDRAKLEFDRREALAYTGSVSGEEVSNSKSTYDSAKAAYDIAAANFEQAKVDLSRTVIYAPIDGTIVKREVQLGQKVRAGTPLMAIVPNNVYVNANFKENQLKNVKIGQIVDLKSDIYGSDVVFHGKITGISGGTGAAFSLIPAQNATGNWIKVVQRLPVRIEIDANELERNPLNIGLSMTARIHLK
jgi:membrane fusion protein (multidrug efflux system)